MRTFDRKAIEKVLTDCGWKIDPFISTCFGSFDYGADGKYPRGAVFTHPIYDTIMIMVKGKTDPTVSRTNNRWEIITCSPNDSNLAYGFTAKSLVKHLQPSIITEKS
jgi:hypothetical protein